MEALEINKCSPVERVRAFHRALSMQHIGVLSPNKKAHFRPEMAQKHAQRVASDGDRAGGIVLKYQHRSAPEPQKAAPPHRSGTIHQNRERARAA